MTAFPAPRRRHAEVDFTDPFVRGELSLSPRGRRALEHHAAAATAKTAAARRDHRRAAQRAARRALDTASVTPALPGRQVSD